MLTVEQAAERLGTSERFVRRLIAERRITYVKLGRHVRITEHERRRTSSTAHLKQGNVGIRRRCHGAVGYPLRSRRDRQ